jgi:hypothetical protein
MDVADRALALLEATPRQFYCEPCLAAALGVAREEARAAAVRLAGHPDCRRVPERCDGCGRVTIVVGSTPPIKCARCSWPIRDSDPWVAEHDDLFHHHCWRILESGARIADSRQMARLSRALIERSLGRFRLP